MLHRSRSSGRDFWWSQLPYGPVLTHISCTKLKIRSAHAEIPIVPKQVSFLVLAIWMRDQSMLHRSRNSERDFLVEPELPCGPVLTPISCTKLKIHLAHAESSIAPKHFFLSCTDNLDMDQSMLHRSRNSERDFWWNQLPCGPVLTPISCTKFKIHSTYEDSPIVPKQVFFLLCWQFGMWDQSMLHRSRKSGRDFWWNQLPCWPVLTPISCTKLKIHSVMNTVQLVLIRFFKIFCWQFG